MALSLWTSFSEDEYALGGIVDQGWPNLWITSGTRSVVEDEDAEDGRAAYLFRSGTAVQKAIAWAAFDVDADRADAEVVMRQKYDSSAGLGSNPRVGAVVRASGAFNSEYGYVASTYMLSNVAYLGIYSYVAGTRTTLASVSLDSVGSFAPGVYHKIRFRCETDESGNVVLSAKVWEDEDEEPPAWMVTYTDTSDSRIITGGAIGIFCYTTAWVDWIGVATGGSTAPTGTGGGDPEEPDLITSGDSCGLAAAGAVSVELQLDGGDVAALLAASSATSAGQLGAEDAAGVAGADAVQGIAAAILSAEYLKVGAAESSPLVAVLLAKDDELAVAASAEDPGVVLARIDRSDALSVRAPTVAQVMARLDAGDQLSLTLDEASRLIGEMVNIAASDAIGVLAGEASGISLHAHADDWLRPALLEMVGEIFSAVNASDGVTLGAIEAADLAALLRSADSAVMRSADGDPVMSVIVDASDAIVLRVSAASFVDVIMSDTGRLIGFVRLVEALGGSVELKPALGGSAALNPEAR